MTNRYFQIVTEGETLEEGMAGLVWHDLEEEYLVCVKIEKAKLADVPHMRNVLKLMETVMDADEGGTVYEHNDNTA